MENKKFNVNLSIYDALSMDGLKKVGRCLLKISKNKYDEKVLCFIGKE